MEKNTPSNLSDVTKVWFSCITGHTGVQVYCDSISMLEIEDQDRKIEQEETGTVSSSVQPEVKCISLAKGSPDFKREGSTISYVPEGRKWRRWLVTSTDDYNSPPQSNLIYSFTKKLDSHHEALLFSFFLFLIFLT